MAKLPLFALDNVANMPYKIIMRVAKMQHNIQLSLRVPLTAEEKEHFRRFLIATGRKAGPWVRTIILKAIAEQYEAKNKEPKDEA